MTQRLPQVQALLSHPGAEAALLPVLRAIPPLRAEVSAVAIRWPGSVGAIPAGPGPLLKAFLPAERPPCDVLLVHADPWHPLPGWAASFVAALRERGGRILAVQRGAFFGPPPPPSLDPDYLLARSEACATTAAAGRRAQVRLPWDSLALWGPAFVKGLDAGARYAVTGTPFPCCRPDFGDGAPSPRAARHAARMEATRVLVLHPGAMPALIALKLHDHWWPVERVAALLSGVVEACREQGMIPIVLPDEADGGESLRLYREVLIEARIERPLVLSPRQWRKLDAATWLTGMAAVITQGGTEGVLAAALGTPALVVAPPDTPYWPDSLAVSGSPYRLVRDPLAYVRQGVELALEAMTETDHDPAGFRDQALRTEGAAEQIARAALDLTHRRRRVKHSRTSVQVPPAAGLPRDDIAAAGFGVAGS